jgi:3-deoxy-D-manno-octulosonic-acid transferase
LGDLAAFYPLGRAAVIGGTLVPGIGGHNPLEAAVCGRAVIHGPHTASFRDGFRCLDEQGGGLPVAGEDQLAVLLARFFEEPEWFSREGEKAAATMRRQRGAVACTLARIEALFHPSGAFSGSPPGKDKV